MPSLRPGSTELMPFLAVATSHIAGNQVFPDRMGWHDGLAERRPVQQVRVGAYPGPAEGNVAGRKRREDVRLVEPVSLLGLSLGDVLLGLMETGERQPDPVPSGAASTTTEDGPVLRLPDGQVERELLLGGFWRHDRTGGLTAPRVVTRREGKALACKLYRVEGD